MANLLGAYVGKSASQAVSNVVEYDRARPEREARREEAKNRAKMSEMQLAEYEANAPVRQAQRSNELSRLEAETYQTNANLAKQQTFDAFKMYDVDGDSRHLNNWLKVSKTNPVAANVTAGMVRLDNLTRTPEVEKMLRQQGIKDLEGFFSDPKLSRMYTIGTRPDGEQTLIDMNRMYAVTGYNQYVTNEQQKELATNFQLIARLRQGANLEDIKQDDAIVGELAESLELPRDEVYRMLREKPAASSGRAGSTIERVAEELRKNNPDMTYRDSLVEAKNLTSGGGRLTNEAAYIEDYLANNPEATRTEALAAYRETGRDERTSKIKNIEYSEDAKTKLDETFGGDFLTADISNLDSKQIAEMAQYVNRIEQVGDLKLSNEDKKNARSIRKLMTVARTAGEGLTAEQTGPIDSVLRSLKSYVSDNVQGKDATTAYEAFRAISRNALFGSQVSSADYAAFNSVVGSLKQQTGPVLASLKTQLSVIRDDMQAMADLNDPYVAKARFGVSLDELDDITNAIQDRIDIINRIVAGKPVEGVEAVEGSGIKVNPIPQDSKTEPGQRRPLDEIFGGQ